MATDLLTQKLKILTSKFTNFNFCLAYQLPGLVALNCSIRITQQSNHIEYLLSSRHANADSTRLI